MEQAGTITAVEDHGSIVLVLLRAEQGWLAPVPFDHRQFADLLDGEDCIAAELIGRVASYDGERFLFLD